MNIFFTNNDPIQCARDHCSVHTVKMILEYSQLLSTAHRVLDDLPEDDPRFYKKTHENHPSAIWVRESSTHYLWLLNLLIKLHAEYTESRGKVHKSYDMLEHFKYTPKNIPNAGWLSNPHIAINIKHFPHIHEQYNRDKDTIAAYKQYLNEKYLEWTDRVERGVGKRNIKAKWYVQKPSWVYTV